MIRTWIKAGAAGLLSRTGLDRMAGSLGNSNRMPLVLGYHRVVEDFASSAATSIPSMMVSRRMLEQHLDWIGRRFEFVSLDELGARLESGAAFDKRIAAVTFDDGYRDFYDHAFPLFQKKGIPAAVFVVSSLVGTTYVQSHDKLYLLLWKRFGHTFRPDDLGALLRRLGIWMPSLTASTPFLATRVLLESLPQSEINKVLSALEAGTSIHESAFEAHYSLTWEMVERIHRAGFTVGSHTRSHVLMTNESRQRVVEEVTESRNEIGNRLKAEVRHFAYPSGRFDTLAVKAVAAAGYRFGYTACGHQDAAHPLLTVPRRLLWENSCLDPRGSFSESIMSCQIHRAFDLVSGCRELHTVNQ